MIKAKSIEMAFGLWHPTEKKYHLRHTVASPWQFVSRFDDILKTTF